MSLVDWVDTRRPLWNLILTAGFHAAFTAVWTFFGLGFYAVFGYGMKEGAPLARWALTGFDSYRNPYRPSRSEEGRGWTVAWKVADSLADFLAPLVVAFLL